MERVVAALLEHYQGRLPLWLSPVQVAVLPVSAEQDEPARQFAEILRAERLRVEIATDGSLGARIRRCRLRRDAVIAVVGAVEAEEGAVQIIDVAADVKATLPVRDVCSRLVQARDQRLAAIPW
jgi:threonyl-tRNA synthetase